MEYIKIPINRRAYQSKDVVDSTMTAAELCELMSEWDDDTPVLVSIDDGYTYGAISEYDIDIAYTEDDSD